MMRRIDARAVGRERTAEEKVRRHLHGDKGARFSDGKYGVLLGRIAIRDRQETIRFKVMPNGNIRAYQSDTYDKRGVPEMQITHPKNCAPTLITEGNIKIYLKYETV